MWQKGLCKCNYLLMIHRYARPIYGNVIVFDGSLSTSQKKCPQVETDSDTPLSIQHRLEILRPPTLVRNNNILHFSARNKRKKRDPSRKQQNIKKIYRWWKMSKTTLLIWSVMEVYASLPPPTHGQNFIKCYHLWNVICWIFLAKHEQS